MSTESQVPELRDAVGAALRERAGADRYRQRQREIRRGRARRPDDSRALRPEGFKATGVRLNLGFAKKVARLLAPR